MTPPPQATIHTRNNRQFYISGLSLTNVLIRYLDDGSFEKIGWSEAGVYKPFCREIKIK